MGPAGFDRPQESAALDRQLPVILLVEPDPFERLQLILMLSDSGYGVRSAGEPADALNIFVTDHPQVALVLWRARMLGVAGEQLRDALHRIASDVPVLAIDQHTYGAYAGHCLDGASTLAEILSKVRRYVPASPAGKQDLPVCPPDNVQAEWPYDEPRVLPSSSSADDAFAWPMPDEEVARIESEGQRRTKRVSDDSEYTDSTFASGLRHISTPNATHVLAMSATGADRFHTIATQDLRDYIADQRRDYLTRQRRLAGIGVTIAATCALVALVFL
jgi:CheY-like chemotaxis protein